MIKKLLLILISSGCFYTSTISAQQGKVDPTFNVLDDGQNGDGFNGPVRTLSLQPDQKLIVGGDYQSLHGTPSPYLTRLNPDGSIDETFNTGLGFNGKVYTTYLQQDGKIIVGGSFTTFNGMNAGRLIRLNSDGSYDPTFTTNIGASTGIIYQICPQPDGKIIISGSFTKYNNVTVNRIARLLPNGNLDTTFMTGSGSALNITGVQILTDNKILLTGNFTVFNNVPANRIVRLLSDGRIDTDFNTGTGFNDDVNAVLVQPDGKILLGGNFTDYNGVPANRIIRINEDATIDTSFEYGTGFSAKEVLVMKRDDSGSIMVGGSFKGSYNGENVIRVCFLNSDGSLKTDFDIGSGPATASVFALENDTEGSWYVGGSFLVFDGLNQGRLAKISFEGEHDTGYLSSGIGFDNSVLKVLPLSNKKTMVFGSFTKFNGVLNSRIARILEDGLQDASFNAGQSGANNSIRSAVLQSDGKIVFGGNFTKYNEIVSNRIIRILPDGAIDNTFVIGLGFNGQVNAIAIQTDQKIIVAGNFTTYSGTPSGRIIRLLEDGSRDTGFNPGIGADVSIETLLIQPDGKILVGGKFNSFNGVSYSRLVRLNSDGSIDYTFNTGSSFDKNVLALALQSDEKIIVGGGFVTYNGTTQKRIVRLNPNGSLDTTFESGTGFSKGEVRSILVQPNDYILIGGTFSGLYKTNSAQRLIRLDKSGNFDPTFESPLNSTLYTMNFTADYRLMIGGNFNSVSGISKHRVARLKLCLESTIWNGAEWSNGLPSGGKQVFFKADYNNLMTANVCSCAIDEGKNVTLLSGNTLGIEFAYTGLGVLIIENNGSLYQLDDDIVNTGKITYKRIAPKIRQADYVYWSTPVSGQRLIDVSPKTASDKYYYNNAPGWIAIDRNSTMAIGKGYIIRGPEDFSNTNKVDYEGSFKGVPNNGIYSTESLTVARYHLLGNPYPSALSVDALVDGNSVINGTVYLWTHNTGVDTSGSYGYNPADYASYNKTGSVRTAALTGNRANDSERPTGFIGAGQAFFVSTRATGAVVFNNSMRAGGTNNSQFFKSTTKEAGIEKNRVWLNMTNSGGLFKQLLVGYIEGATNGYENRFDGITMDGNSFLDFYSMINSDKFVIQGRGLPFTDTDLVPLGYRTTIAGDFTIAIDEVDGKMSDQKIYIEDKTTGVVHDLTQSNYTFKTEVGTFTDRLLLRYTGKTLGTGDFENIENGILVSVKNKVINILSSKENIREVTVYDISGKLLYDKKKVGSTELEISNLHCNNQVLLVKVILENSKSKQAKFCFKTY